MGKLNLHSVYALNHRPDDVSQPIILGPFELQSLKIMHLKVIGLNSKGFREAASHASTNLIGSKELIQFLQQNTQLVSLTLEDVISHYNVQGICKTLETYSSLERLEIQGFDKNTVSGSVFKNLASVNCKELVLEECLTDEITESVFGQDGILQVASLSIVENRNLSVTSVKKIASSLSKNVKSLKFKLQGDAMVTALLDALEANNSLTSLNLAENDIKKEGSLALSKFLSKNRSVKELILDNNLQIDASILANGLKANSTLQTLSIHNWSSIFEDALKANSTLQTLSIHNWSSIFDIIWPISDYIDWVKALKESCISKLCVDYISVITANTATKMLEYIKGTPTLEDIEYRGISIWNKYCSTSKNNDQLAVKNIFKEALETNKIIKAKKIAKQMVVFHKELLSSLEMGIKSVDMSEVTLNGASTFANIAFLYAIHNNINNLKKALGENNKLIDDFLINYKNNNGFILAGIHKVKGKFDPLDVTKPVSEIVSLPPKIWDRILAYLTIEDLYKIVHKNAVPEKKVKNKFLLSQEKFFITLTNMHDFISTNTSSKIEEVVDELSDNDYIDELINTSILSIKNHHTLIGAVFFPDSDG